MIIKQSSTDQIIMESKRDFLFLDGKRVKDSDYHIEHTVGDVVYRVYFNRAGVHIQSDSEHECAMTLSPGMIARHPKVSVAIKTCKY
jgi:hypothetical protein